MTTSVLTRIASRARRRRIAVQWALWLPWIFVAAYAAWRFAGVPSAALIAAIGLVAPVMLSWRSSRTLDRDWLVRSLDDREAALQDSADLLFAPATALNPLEALQQARVRAALERHASLDLREPWPHKRILFSMLAAAGAATLLWFWQPVSLQTETASTSAPTTIETPPAVQSLQATLQVTPPKYTDLPLRRLDDIEGVVEEGSELAWDLHFAIEPTAVRLRFVEGDALELTQQEGDWRATRKIDASTLYRIEFDGAPPLPERAAYRLEMKPDLAPQITVLQPEKTLTVLDAAAARWSLMFDAIDDYALGAAELELTLAQGSGEQVTVSERRVALRGTGDARRQHFEHRVDLAALGFAQGDDLIARVVVRDRRAPKANITRSPSFILRWPPPRGADGTGVEGLVQQNMPAYFRSQRQIIIDTEALIAQRSKFSADEYVVRSDVIGADQRLLRLKYGQFLGEESESENEAAEHHDEGGGSVFDQAHELMADAGHLHDLPEAATLLDPDTRRLLRSALDAMWQAERELRTGNPVAALPYENRALEFIKRVQQADRIYLARVGLELPQLDVSRRLTGERPAASLRNDPLLAHDAGSVPAQMWQALQSGTDLPLDALAQWIDGERERLEDPLSMLAEIDALRRNADCGDCRERLAEQIWSVLTPPPATPSTRIAPDAVGRAYLDALAPTGESP
jgi:hypothetical protein